MAYVDITQDLFESLVKYCYNLWYNRKKGKISLLTDSELENMITEIYYKGCKNNILYISSINLNNIFIEYIKRSNLEEYLLKDNKFLDNFNSQKTGIKISPVMLKALIKQYTKKYKYSNKFNLDLIVLEIISISENQKNFILNKYFLDDICTKYINLEIGINL
ncbi:hypothetical protein [Clostridioides difficile]|uniref:hypothetical protein n=1 Tax=Clostridioides difficile TaxID=1496 RepID=UPI001033709D|nr:hypothetical protein [Clostridioides difficile]MDM9943966.1 hypothetical protein [Clostridioides difficile]